MIIIKALCFFATSLFLFFAYYPIRFGVFNVGNIVLIALAVITFLFPIFIGLTKNYLNLRIFVVLFYIAGTLTIAVTSVSMFGAAYNNNPPNNDAYTLIVLGAKVNSDGPSLMLARRLNKAAEYLNANPESTVIVSGGQGHDEPMTEALAMADYLVRGWKISPDRIILEDKSTNTKENLEFSSKLIPENSSGVVIVTDNFHQLRAKMLARSIGLENTYGIASLTPPGLLPAYWMRDLGGVVIIGIQNVFKK